MNNISKKLQRYRIFFCYLYFATAIIFYILIKFVTQYTWLTSGEMWAESVNYYYNSISGSFYKILFSTDFVYWAFFQRIIAYLGVLFRIPVEYIPYYYNACALIFPGLFVAPFCLPLFRRIIPNDIFRFIICISLLCLSDFETSAFISFTYYSIFFITIVSILAFVKGKYSDIPAWSWVIPILIINKPSHLILIPLMILFAFYSNKRFKHITAVSCVLAAAQVVRILLSMESLHKNSNLSLFEKCYYGLIEFFKNLPLMLTGDLYHLHTVEEYIITGSIIFIVISIIIYVLYKKSNKKSFGLCFSGIWLTLCNIIMLWISQYGEYENKLILHMTRYMFVDLMGFMLVLIGICAVIEKKYKNLGMIIYVVWFVFSGWLITGIKNSITPVFPHFGNSKWQKLKDALKYDNRYRYCIPIDPDMWAYEKDKCIIINQFYNISPSNEFIDADNRKYKVKLEKLNTLKLSYFLIVLHPIEDNNITGKAFLTYKNGETAEIESTEKINSYIGTMIFQVPDKDEIIDSISFQFDKPVKIYINKEIKFPVSKWLGVSKEIN